MSDIFNTGDDRLRAENRPQIAYFPFPVHEQVLDLELFLLGFLICEDLEDALVPVVPDIRTRNM